MEFLKTLAPMLGTALGGPLGGAAAAFIADKLGIESKTVEAVTEVLNSGKMTPDQISAIKLAEMDFKKFLESNKIKMEEIAAADRNSARNREVQVKDNTNKILAFTVVGAFIAMVGATLMGFAKVESVLAGTLVGYLSAKAEQVLAYYFGSSAGSKDKTALLAKAEPVK